MFKRLFQFKAGASILHIQKYYVFDENQKPIAVQIPIAEFERLEQIIEDYGLAKLMDEVDTEETLTGEAAYQYYRSLKSGLES